jgi:uncharacterized protein YndB with AHSA1/START domain
VSEQHHELDVAASLEEVWRLLTTATGLTAWYATTADIAPEAGAIRRLAWGDEPAEARITDVEPMRRLHLVHLDADGEPVGAEEWLLSHDRGTTHVRLVQTIPDGDTWADVADDLRRGWRLFLASLRFALEEADQPERVAEARWVPARGRDRHRLRDDLLTSATLPPHRVLVDDPPHSLLVAVDGDTTLLVDLEGSGADLAAYVQAATHGPDDPARRRRRRALLEQVATDAPG